MATRDEHANETKIAKDTWDKVSVVSKALIPLVLGIVGWLINSTLKDRELNAEYVKLAVGVLQNTDTSRAVTELRKWGATVLNDLGPVKLSPELLRAIERGEVQFPHYTEITSMTWRTGRFVRTSLSSAPHRSLIIRVNGRDIGITPLDTVLQEGRAQIEWIAADGRRVCSLATALVAGGLFKALCNTETGTVTQRW